MKNRNKGLFLIIGECFRTGGQNSRIRGLSESYLDQEKACRSHINLINFLEKKHSIKIDVILNSYSTKYDNHIINWYHKTNLINYKFNAYPLGYNRIFLNGIDLIKDKNNYNFIFVNRIDLVLKNYLKKVFDIRTNKITFPFPMPLGSGKEGYNMWISETMVLIPSNHFDKKLTLSHEFLNYHQNIKSDIGYFVNTFHRANSSYGWNPIYRMANRKESNVWDVSNFICNEQHDPIFYEKAGGDFKYFL